MEGLMQTLLEKRKQHKEKKEKKSKDKDKEKSLNPASPSIKDKEMCGDYILIETVGKGGFGTVFRALHKDKGNFVAVKKIRLSNMVNKEQLDTLMMEITLLKKLKHKNIVKYVDHFRDKKGHTLYIVMEYMEIGSLEHMIKKYGVFPESLVKTYVRQLLEGLVYLHDQGVIHRDIKCANILISSNGAVKLADFGVSTHLSDVKDQSDMSGTPYWMAPEVTQMSGITSACDIWSLGCTIIELLTGLPPYFSLNTAQALYKIVTDDHPPLPEGISKGLQDILLRCFQKDEKMRITAKKLLQHPWISRSESNSDETDLDNVKNELNDYNKALQEVGKKIQISAFPTVARRQRSFSIDTEFVPPSLANRSPKKGHLHRSDSKLGMVDVLDIQDFASKGKEQVESPPLLPKTPTRTDSPVATRLTGRPKQLSMYQEKEEDLSEGFSELSLSPAKLGITQVSVNADWNDEIEDTFDEIDRESVLEDKYRDQLLKDIQKLIDDLFVIRDENLVIKSCSQLRQMLKHNPKEKTQLISRNGILPVLDQLMYQNKSQGALLTILQLINEIISEPDIQESLCLLGGVPLVMHYTTNEYNHGIRTEVAKFVGILCSATTHVAQMFVSCRTFPLIVNLLEPNYEEGKEMIHFTLDAIIKIFKIHMATPKHAFCHIFCNAGIIMKLANGLTIIDGVSLKPDVQSFFLKLSEIFLLFSHAESNIVKEELCKSAILKRVKTLLHYLLPKGESDPMSALTRDGLLTMLKVVRHLSAPPSNRDAIEQAGLIETLVGYLKVKQGVDKIQEIHNQILNTLFNLCQLSDKRQERAAIAGLVDAVIPIISQEKGPLKAISCSIVFDMVKSSPITRDVLWESNVMQVFQFLLADPNWFKDTMEALAFWVAYNKEKMSTELVQNTMLHTLANVFQFNKHIEFAKVLPAFLKLITESIPLNKAIGPLVIPSILPLITSLNEPSSRLSLLKMLRSLYANADNRADLWTKYNVLALLHKLSETDPSVLVTQMADQMLEDANNSNNNNHKENSD